MVKTGKQLANVEILTMISFVSTSDIISSNQLAQMRADKDANVVGFAEESEYSIA